MDTQLEPQKQLPAVCHNCQDIEAKMRMKALGFANNAALLMLVAHIAFEWTGRHLPIPEIVWAAMFTPWAGAAAWKIARWVKR
jgi:hypothetical protein